MPKNFGFPQKELQFGEFVVPNERCAAAVQLTEWGQLSYKVSAITRALAGDPASLGTLLEVGRVQDNNVSVPQQGVSLWETHERGSILFCPAACVIRYKSSARSERRTHAVE